MLSPTKLSFLKTTDYRKCSSKSKFLPFTLLATSNITLVPNWQTAHRGSGHEIPLHASDHFQSRAERSAQLIKLPLNQLTGVPEKTC